MGKKSGLKNRNSGSSAKKSVGDNSSANTGFSNVKKEVGTEKKSTVEIDNNAKTTSKGSRRHATFLSRRINRGNRKWYSLGIIFFIFIMRFIQNSSFYKTHTKSHLKSALPFESASHAKDVVESTFLESWSHYVDDAFGYDMYHPLNRAGERGSNMLSPEEPLGWFVVDSIDTLMVMYNNTENPVHKEKFAVEIARCEQWIKSTLNYDIDHDNLNVFETTIRMLGGLLSAYYMSSTFNIGDSSVYLDKAVDLGQRLVNIYNNDLSIPLGKINLHSGSSSYFDGYSGVASLAEFTTLQLEFKYLHVLRPGVFPDLWEKSELCYDVIESNNDLYGEEWQGLIPIFIDPFSGRFNGHTIRLGSRADSYYEYLIKQYIFSPNNQTEFYDRFVKSMNGIKKNLLGTTPKRSGKFNGGLTYIGEKNNGLKGSFSSKFDHLVCFIGGSLMLGATKGLSYDVAQQQTWWNDQSRSDWKLGLEITRTCYSMYSENEVTGLAPEIAVFNSDKPNTVAELNHGAVPDSWWASKNKDFYVKPADAHNLQRPETVESIFYAYQFTKSPTFRKWNWSILQSFVKQGMICLQDVTKPNNNKMNNVESFWFSETLKYIYMTFLDDVDLSSIVFNTEAHIFPTLKDTE